MPQMNIEVGCIPVPGFPDKYHIKVESTSESGKWHYVQADGNTGTVEKCSCDAFSHRPGPCKHMLAVVRQRTLQRGM